MTKMTNEEIINLAKELETFSNKVEFCDNLLGHHKLKKLEEAEIAKLYGFSDAVDKLYGVVHSAVSDVEQVAFEAFEKCSADILNEQWKKELKKKKRIQWMAKHQGVGGEKGSVQVGLTAERGTAHLEWTPVNTKSMLWGSKYKVELQVEDADKSGLADQWRRLFREQAILLPKNCTMGKGPKTVLVYEVQTRKPIAKMSKKELDSFLKKVYIEDLNYCCRVIVEGFRH